MARVRYLERADLAPDHQPLYDAIAASRGGVPPNFKALRHSPVASARMAVLGAYVRFETPLPARIKTLALLTAAREAEGDSVWAMNQPQARSAGLGEDIINAIRERRAPDGLAPEEASIVQWLLLDSRVVDLPRSSNLIVVTLPSLKPLFFNGLKKALPFSDNIGA